MPTLTATTELADNGYTTTDVTAAATERIINKASAYVNLRAKSAIPEMSGAEGSKTLTVTREQYAPLSMLITCMLREAKKSQLSNSSSTGSSTSTSKSIGVGQINVSDASSMSSAISAAASLNNADDFTRAQFEEAIRDLRSFENEIEVSRG